MRLLHVHSGNLYGGVEALLQTIVRCRGFCPEMQSEFALCFEGRIAAELRQAGAVVHLLGRVRARNPLQIIRARRRLIQILDAGAFDAAICHMPWPLAIFAPAVRRARIPLIFWMHDAATYRNWLHLWAGLASPELTLCNSRFTASTLARLFGNTPSETIYYPVAASAVRLEAAERNTIRASLNTPSEAVVIVQASRMEAWKGHRLLLESLAKLRAVPQWICWIVGGAQRAEEVAYERNLRATAAEMGFTERIRFLGQREDVAQLLAAADIYCQPNLAAEPFGIVFIEAMQAGLPVITSAAGGPLEIVDDSCGLLVSPDDVCSLAAGLTGLIEDGVERRRLGAAGARRAARLCDPSRQLQHLHAIIQQRVVTASSQHPNASKIRSFGFRQ
jgi:glycosyltransferase involved in cell wall biosynthesis